VASRLRNVEFTGAAGRKRDGDQAEQDENQNHEQLNANYKSLSFGREKKQAHRSILASLKHNDIYISFIIYIVIGTLFYTFDKGNELSGILGFYQSITIGYSVGLGSKDPNYLANPWFSTFYILFGAALIAVLLTKVGQRVEESASMNMFEALKRREDYEQKLSRDNPFCTRFKAFIQYNAAYLVTILVWVVWLSFIVVWSLISTSGLVDKWDFADAQYFAVSLCSSAGSFSLPPECPEWAYLLAAISMLFGVPIMALAVSSIVIMLWQGHKFKQVKEAAWEPVATHELEALNKLGLAAGGVHEIAKGEFILLALLRMGQDGGIINYLSDVFDASEQRGGVLVKRNIERDVDNTGFYSDQASAYVGCNDSSKINNSDAQKRWSTAASADGLGSSTSVGLEDTVALSNIRSTAMGGSLSLDEEQIMSMEAIDETGTDGIAGKGDNKISSGNGVSKAEGVESS